MLCLLKESKIESVLSEIMKSRDELEFFIVSHDLDSDNTFPTLHSAHVLVPPQYVIEEYIGGSSKKAKKKYAEYIMDNEEVFVVAMNIATSISLGKRAFILVSDIEYDLGYAQDLISIISSRYGIATYNHKTIKDIISSKGKLKLKDNPFSEDGYAKLKKDLKDYKHLFFDEGKVEETVKDMSKKELKRYILEKLKMSKEKFENKFGKEPDKKKMVKYILKNK